MPRVCLSHTRRTHPLQHVERQVAHVAQLPADGRVRHDGILDGGGLEGALRVLEELAHAHHWAAVSACVVEACEAQQERHAVSSSRAVQCTTDAAHAQQSTAETAAPVRFCEAPVRYRLPMMRSLRRWPTLLLRTSSLSCCYRSAYLSLHPCLLQLSRLRSLSRPCPLTPHRTLHRRRALHCRRRAAPWPSRRRAARLPRATHACG